MSQEDNASSRMITIGTYRDYVRANVTAVSAEIGALRAASAMEAAKQDYETAATVTPLPAEPHVSRETKVAERALKELKSELAALKPKQQAESSSVEAILQSGQQRPGERVLRNTGEISR